MLKHPLERLRNSFSEVEDARAKNVSHLLIDIIVLAICGVLSGADSWVEVEKYGQAKHWFFRAFLELPHGIPSHDTFGRVFSKIDPKQFREGFFKSIKFIANLIEQHVAIDGKVLRRSHDKTNNLSALNMVSAWASKNRMVIGQEKVRDKSNEIVAIPILLDLIDIANCTVTIDAIGCQTEIVAIIIDSDADYALALKKNQLNLYETVKGLFDDPDEIEKRNCNYHKDINKGHGRIEVRECWATNDESYLNYIKNELGEWAGLQSLVMVQAERHINGEVSVEKRYYISSLPPDAENLLNIIRSHWGIENSLHWVLDMAFREDESRVRQGHAAENFAIIRHLCLNLLKKETTAQCGIKAKRMLAGWDMNYLFKVLSG